MKRIFSLIVFSAICCSVFSQLSCDPTLWPHVYKPERLTGDKKCMTIKGMVRLVTSLPDGGYRVLIKLDPGQPTTLLNDKNMSMAKGCVVIEIICAHRPISNPEALKSCGSFESTIKVPALNDHVQVTGTYILDTENGWFALYPVSNVTELQRR